MNDAGAARRSLECLACIAHADAAVTKPLPPVCGFATPVGQRACARVDGMAEDLQSARKRAAPRGTYFLNIGSSGFPALRIYATRSCSSSGLSGLISPGGIIERLYGCRDLIAVSFTRFF